MMGGRGKKSCQILFIFPSSLYIMKKIEPKEKMRKLINNTSEHITRVMINFAEQYNELIKEIELDTLTKSQEVKDGRSRF